MSVFKRLGNIAKGKVRVWTRDPRPADDRLDHELGTLRDKLRASEDQMRTAGLDVPEAEAQTADAAPTEATGRRGLLRKALRDGVLTRDEYDEKIAALDEEERPRPRKPKKRTL